MTDGLGLIRKQRLGECLIQDVCLVRRRESLVLMDKQARVGLELIEKHEPMDLLQVHLSDRSAASWLGDGLNRLTRRCQVAEC